VKRLVLARVESVNPDGSAVLKPLADKWEEPGSVRDAMGLRPRRCLMPDVCAQLPSGCKCTPMRARRDET
jgi:hypothetical protein